MRCLRPFHLSIATVLLLLVPGQHSLENKFSERLSDVWMPKITDVLRRCLMGVTLSTGPRVRELWFVCVRRVVSSCMLKKRPTTEPSYLSRYCGWVLLTPQTLSALPSITTIVLVPEHGMNLTFTQFQIPWTGTGCPELGLDIALPSGDLFKRHCGSRLPWSTLVPSSRVDLVAYGHQTAAPYVQVVASYELVRQAALMYQRDQPLVVAGDSLPKFPLESRESTVLQYTGRVKHLSSAKLELTRKIPYNTWPVTWHIIAHHSRYIWLNITRKNFVAAEMTVYDGPGRLSPVLKVDKTQFITVVETTAFQATIDMAAASILQDVSIQYSTVSQWNKMKEDQYQDCRQPAWFRSTFPIGLDASLSKSSNTVCMTRLLSERFLDLPGYGSSVELSIDSFSFKGPKMLHENLDFDCQYGGFYLHYTLDDRFQNFMSMSFCGSETLSVPKVLILNHPTLLIVWFSGYSHGHFKATMKWSTCVPMLGDIDATHRVVGTLPRSHCNYLLMNFTNCVVENDRGCQVDFEMENIPLKHYLVGGMIGFGDTRIGSLLVEYEGPADSQNRQKNKLVERDGVLSWVLDSGEKAGMVLSPGDRLDWRNVTVETLRLTVQRTSWQPGFLMDMKMEHFAAFSSHNILDDGDDAIKLNSINYFYLHNPYSNSKKVFYLTAHYGYRMVFSASYRYGCPIDCRKDKYVITETYNHSNIKSVITWRGDQISLNEKKFYFHGTSNGGMLFVERKAEKECLAPSLKTACQLTLTFMHPPTNPRNGFKEEKETISQFAGNYTLYRPVSRNFTWLEAEEACVKDGGHLSSYMSKINHAEDVDFSFLNRLESPNPLQNILLYIGLNDLKMAGSHVWVDGSAVTAVDWSHPDRLENLPDLEHTDQEFDYTDDTDPHQDYILELLQKHQPTHDLEERCTAMVLTSRLDVLGWVKLPCSRRLHAYFFCFNYGYDVFFGPPNELYSVRSGRLLDTYSSVYIAQAYSKGFYLRQPNIACAKKGWILFGSGCYYFASLKKPVTAFEIDLTCARFGGEPAKVFVRIELLKLLLDDAYDCAVYKTISSCTSLTYTKLSVEELGWFMKLHAKKLEHELKLFNTSYVLKSLLMKGIPFYREPVNHFYHYKFKLDQTPDYYNKYHDLADILYLLREQSLEVDTKHPLSLTVQTELGLSGVLFWDRMTRDWLFRAQRGQNVLTADYVMCRSEPARYSQTCSSSHSVCLDGTCIIKERLCDGRADCPDYSDETNCTFDFSCDNPNHFLCHSGGCIPLHQLCDGHIDCLDQSDELYCTIEACSINSFMCRDRSCISSNNVCDGLSHCPNAEDEKDCHSLCKGFSCSNGRCVPNMYVNDYIAHCPFAEDEQVGRDLRSVDSTNVLLQQCPVNHLDNAQISCKQTNVHVPPCFNIADWCVLRASETPCQNGYNLLECKAMGCSGMFRCSFSYCIPIYKVCDGVFDCKNEQDDERGCHNLTCSGMLKCPREDVCVPQENVCDGVVHCKRSRDDEIGCDLFSDDCDVDGYLIRCNYTDKTSFAPISNLYVSALFLGNVPKVLNLKSLLPPLTVNFMKIENGSMTQLLGLNRHSEVARWQNLHFLTVIKTLIRKVSADTLYGLTNVQVLDLAHNHIFHVEDNSFAHVPYVKVLLLHNNQISRFFANTFNGLSHLVRLDVRQNMVTYIDLYAFKSMKALKILEIENFRACCLLPSTVRCSTGQTFISSCSNLIGTLTQKCLIWTMGTLGLFGNALVVYMIVYRNPRAQRQKSVLDTKHSFYSVLVINMALSDGLMSFYLLILGTVDAYFAGDFYAYMDAWKVHFGCKLLGFISLFSLQMTLLTLLIIAIVRLVATIFPLKLRLFQVGKKIVAFLCGPPCLVSILVALTPLLSYPELRQDVSMMPNTVCMFLDFTLIQSSPVKAFYLVLIVFDSLVITSMVACYCWLYRHLQEPNAELKIQKSKQADSSSKLLINILAVVLTDCLTWVPVLVLMTLTLSQVSLSPGLTVWVVVVILPLNSALNPFVYTFGAVLRRVAKKLLTRK